MCWPKYCGLYLSCRRKALTSSCFSGASTMPPFLSCLMVNVFPGNASFSCCFVTLKSVCGLRLSRMIGVIFLSFVLCVWVIDLVCWLVCGVFGVVVLLCSCVFVWVELLCGVSCLFVCVAEGLVLLFICGWLSGVVGVFFGDVFVYVDFRGNVVLSLCWCWAVVGFGWCCVVYFCYYLRYVFGCEERISGVNWFVVVISVLGSGEF